MSNPIVSIIVPVYNVEKYIDRCIESVIIQDFQSWEMILVDDGSSDRTLNICERYAKNDKRISVFHQKNQGVSTARNYGIRNANGRFLTFIDGDDYWKDKSFLSKIANYFDYDVVYTPNLYLQYPDGIIIKEVVSDQYVDKTVFDDNPGIYLAMNSKTVRWGCVCFIIKRNIIYDNAIMFDPKVKLGEDGDWVFRGLLKSKRMKIYEDLNYVYCVNRNESAMSHKTTKAILSYFYMVNKWKSISEHEKDVHPIYTMFCNNALDYYHMLSSYSKEERRLLYNAMRKSGAFENATSKTALKIKKVELFFGKSIAIQCLGARFKIRQTAKLLINYVKPFFSSSS